MVENEHARTGWRNLPSGIWALGFVSLFMDMSSELIHSLLPVFLVSSLGASMAMVGVIEGLAEATANIVKMFSGYISDRLQKRKLLAVIGYGLAAIVKPLFPLAGGVGAVFTARIIDRVGKGIRAAPRDALVGDITPPEMRGAAYGLRQSMDTVGAFLGPLLAVVLMLVLHGDIRTVFWFAVIPAALAVAVLIFGVREPGNKADGKEKRQPMSLKQVAALGRAFWIVVFIGALVNLARFSEAFLVLRAEQAGLAHFFIPFVLILMNVSYAVSAYPFGLLSDKVSRYALLFIGLVVLAGADIALAVSGDMAGVFAGIALWGLHMGLSQGILAALVADKAAPERRATAFGVFNFISGVVLLCASLFAGILWDEWGSAAPFYAGLVFALFAMLAIAVYKAGDFIVFLSSRQPR